MHKYDAKVKTRWGDTAAYREYKDKTAGYDSDKWQTVNDGLNAVFWKFSECLKNGKSCDSIEVLNLVKQLQNYITENYYACTDDILSGLGQMYVSDEQFKTNIDKCGEGTAYFVSLAIKNYCK